MAGGISRCCRMRAVIRGGSRHQGKNEGEEDGEFPGSPRALFALLFAQGGAVWVDTESEGMRRPVLAFFGC